MRLSNISRLFFVAAMPFVFALATTQDAIAQGNLFALGRAPGGNPGTSLLEVDVSDALTNPLEIADITVVSGAPDDNFNGLAFQPGTGTLFVSTGGPASGGGSIPQSSNPNTLFTMDPSTGVATLVDPMGAVPFGVQILDLAFDAGGTLYGNTEGQLYTIDPTTGVETITARAFDIDGDSGLLGNAATRINTIAVDPTTDMLYGISWDDSELFVIDAATGAATSQGTFGTGADLINMIPGTGLEGLAGAGVAMSGLAFDSMGNLYVSTGNQNGAILAIDINDLTAVTSLGGLEFNDVADRDLPITIGDILSDEENGGAEDDDIGSLGGLAFRPAAAGQAGDFDGDTDVDGADFLAWQRDFANLGAAGLADFEANFGTGVPPAAGAASAIPEPSAIALLMLGVIGLGTRRNRKS